MEPRQNTGENLPLPQPAQQEAPGLSTTEATPAPPAEIIAGRNEQTERRLGQRVETAAQAPAAPAASLPAPVPPIVDDAVAKATQQSDDDLPQVAADDDLIEKEWVDKAKKVIADTRDDPYRREQEVKRLQVEYVRKRYGREIGHNDEEI